jgi:hypothetical protein
MKNLSACSAALLAISSVSLADEPSPKSAVYVEPVTLTEVNQIAAFDLNIGAIVLDDESARGLQKAADVYGLKLDVFVERDSNRRKQLAESFVANNEAFIIVDKQSTDDWNTVSGRAKSAKIPFQIISDVGQTPESRYEQGFAALREARAALVSRIPKYDQIVPIAFPVSPMPDNFFQPSKFPYPSPLVRAPRTNESVSASVHAHTSCNMIAQTGNMLHRTSSGDPNRLLMGMEGGNLSLQALPGAIDKAKLSAVMTSWVLNIKNEKKEASRHILVENNGLDSSQFTVGIHAPEELELALAKWRDDKKIRGFRWIDHERILVEGWDGADRTMRAGLFLIANDQRARGPVLVPGTDRYGAKALDFFSTQAFVQQLVEVVTPDKVDRKRATKPTGGLLTAAGTTTGNLIGSPLSHWLRKVDQKAAPVQPYVMALEGGFVVVTPEDALTATDFDTAVEKVNLDLRGPLTSDQTIRVDLAGGRRIVFRRSLLDFDHINDALGMLKSMGMTSGWDFEGARGRGLFANVVLYDLMGRHRKFMSSLSTWPTDEHPSRPLVRFYVDGMQRLNFALITPSGWRQEFVEVPLRIPPVPRDIDLYSGKSTLE